MFADYDPKVLSRYSRRLGELLREKRPDVNLIYVYYHEGPTLTVAELERVLPPGSQVVPGAYYREKSLRAFFSKHRPDLLVLGGQRLSDAAYAAISRDELGIPSVMIQHGFPIPFLVRVPSLVLQHFGRTVRYLCYLRMVANTARASFLRYLWEYGEYFWRGANLASTTIDERVANADHVLVYSDYWKRFHRDMYGYTLEQQSIFGYPDLANLESIRSQPQQRAVCYIAQTLVEDGRMKESEYRRFLSLLAGHVGVDRLIVKLHPRSDARLYGIFNGMPGVSIERDAFPHCDRYLTHYSSAIVLGAFLTPGIMLWELSGHPTPLFMRGFAQYVGNDIERLRSFMATGEYYGQAMPPGRLQELQELTYYEGGDPLARASDLLASWLFR